MKRFLSLLILLVTLLNAKEGYELGNGLQIASLPVYVGGYASAQFKRTENEFKYSLENLALLSYGNHQNLSYMAEVEYNNLYVEQTKNDIRSKEEDTRLYVERLYLEYNFNENFTARLGQYISPIGFWNMLPINVLRDTTSDPISTNIIFPELTTGFYGVYTIINKNELKIDLMLQNNESIDNKYNNYQINKHYGIGVTYNHANFSSKLNIGYFNKLYRLINEEYQTSADSSEVENVNSQEDDDDYIKNSLEEQLLYYVNLSLRYDTPSYQILSEFGHQEAQSGPATNYAFYLQGLYRATSQQSAIIRFEAYDDKVSSTKDLFSVFAYTYRPIYPVALKAEYQFHLHSKFNKVLISLSVLF